MRCKEEVVLHRRDKALPWVAQSIPGGAQGQAEQGLEQPGIAQGIPTNGRGME